MVYDQGVLKDGRLAAIKVLSLEFRLNADKFLREISVISEIQHENLVELYGCCVEGGHRILVYGYLENSSLEHTLLGKCIIIFFLIKFFWENLRTMYILFHQNILHELNAETFDFQPHIAGEGVSNIKFNWQARCRICIGVARGLEFLHDQEQPNNVHRDIRASNIVLDEDLKPKISDFGLANLIRQDVTRLISL